MAVALFAAFLLYLNQIYDDVFVCVRNNSVSITQLGQLFYSFLIDWVSTHQLRR